MINLDDLLDSMADDDDNTEDEHFADDGKSQSEENVDLPQDEEMHDDVLPDADEEAALRGVDLPHVVTQAMPSDSDEAMFNQIASGDEEEAASDSVRMDPIHEAAEPEAVQAEL